MPDVLIVDNDTQMAAMLRHIVSERTTAAIAVAARGQRGCPGHAGAARLLLLPNMPCGDFRHCEVTV